LLFILPEYITSLLNIISPRHCHAITLLSRHILFWPRHATPTVICYFHYALVTVLVSLASAWVIRHFAILLVVVLPIVVISHYESFATTSIVNWRQAGTSPVIVSISIPVLVRSLLVATRINNGHVTGFCYRPPIRHNIGFPSASTPLLPPGS